MALYVAVSSIHKLGLFSDKQIALGKDICFVFNRIDVTGIFANDFKETLYGRFTNHSDTPNADTIILPENIVLRAKKTINDNEEITASYHSLIQLFNNDQTLIKLIKFW